MASFLEKCSRIDALKSEIMPWHLTLFNAHVPYVNEAVECFHEQLFISCIVVSSALVEICLCWEHWSQKPEEERKNIQEDEFRNVNLGNLFRKFANSNIPIDKLLDFDEREQLTKTGKVDTKSTRFIMARNKFAHGSLVNLISLYTLISGHEKDWLDYGIDDEEWITASLETVAYVQLLKTLRFIKAFTDYLIEKEITRNK
jgi:hypothetical protein